MSKRSKRLYVSEINPEHTYFTKANFNPVTIICTQERGWKRGYVDWSTSGTWEYFTRFVTIKHLSGELRHIPLVWCHQRKEYYIDELTDTLRSDQIATIQYTINSCKKEIKKLQDKIERLTLVAKLHNINP